jgi:mono/diheme cytochrome c family protein
VLLVSAKEKDMAKLTNLNTRSNAARRSALIFCLLPFALLFSACRQDMHDNPRYEAYEEGAQRQLPEGAVARGSLALTPTAQKAGAGPAGASAGGGAIGNRVDAAPATTTGAGQTGQAGQAGQAGQMGQGAQTTAARATVPTGPDGFPFAITKEILDRGQSRYEISCMPCHGKVGNGDGMIVLRGFRKPPSYHEARLVQAPTSYYYDVITNGFGAMYSYADQLTPEDRWKVIAYIRVLQMSQNVNLNQLAADVRPNVEKGLAESERRAAERAKQNQPTSAPAQGGHGNQ